MGYINIRMWCGVRKKMAVNYLGLLLSAGMAIANPIDDICSQFVYKGAPISKRINTIYECNANYAINYRTDTKTAEYVVERVEYTPSGVERVNDFKADTKLPSNVRSELIDYAGQSYDRGHLSPAADNTASTSIMADSFLLSNMVPQNPANNRGIWKKLETQTRTWAKSYGPVYVVTGTLYNPVYKTIGIHKVGVPDFMWKVIVSPSTNRAISFLIPNQNVPAKDLPTFAMTIDNLESLTSLNFMPNLNTIDEANLESKIGFSY